ncbi:MAG: GIY-YIG nuclease family protein [Prolixibacteraceae bacterium]|nr:GIY-YIG nuclease family protein [Prolixibacteraceae bacterium]
MYFTYVLYSSTFNKIYVGQTCDLNQRLETHNGIENTGWTSHFQPWEMIYFEEFTSRTEAIKRENSLKTARGRMFVWELVKNKLNAQTLP